MVSMTDAASEAGQQAEASQRSNTGPQSGGKLLTFTAFAQQEGLAQSRISQLVSEGMPVEADGRLDATAARAWMDSRLDPGRREARKPGSSRGKAGTVADLRAKKLAGELRLLELEARKREGDVVERAAVDRFLFERARMERDAWIGWIARTVPLMAAKTGAEPSAVFAFLDRAVREHLAELAETPLQEIANAR